MVYLQFPVERVALCHVLILSLLINLSSLDPTGPDSDTKNVWGFGFQSAVSSTATWSVPVNNHVNDWSNSNHVAAISSKTSPTPEIDEEFVEIGSTDNLQSVLEKLSLSNYLSNFQVI